MSSREAAMATSCPPVGRLYEARIRSSDRLGSLQWLTLHVPGWGSAHPGQFAMLRSPSSGCFLARPFSIAHQDGELVSFLVAPVGPATRELSSGKTGDLISLLGPLGNGFDLGVLLPEGRSRRLLLVGGGAGIAPFPLLLGSLTSRVDRATKLVEVVVLMGFRDVVQAQGASPVIAAAERARAAGMPVRVGVVTEDGSSSGPAAKVTDLLREELQADDVVATCGSPAMSKAVWSLCESATGVQTWFSLETVMACGIGSCHGCAVEFNDGSIVRVCRDGPVFSGREIYGRESKRDPDTAERTA